MIFDFSILPKALPYLLRGALITLQIAFFSSIIGFVLGTIIGFLQYRSYWLVKILATAYVTLFRGTPMLIQITFMSLILPPLGFSLLTTAIIAIGLNSAAYISQIIRAGIASVSKGQLEAGTTLGMTPLQTIKYIIFPQAITIVIPALLSEFIVLIKDSSLASIIGVTELFKEGNIIISRTYNAIPIYCAVAALYLLLTMSLTMIVYYMKRRWDIHALD